MDHLLRVDVTRGTVEKTPLPESYTDLGGRALTVRILLDEVKPTCEPLGPHNKLIFAAGLLAGTAASSCGRLSVGGKSPLTGGVKESNAGGIVAARMAGLGYRAIVLEGKPATEGLKILLVDADGGRLEPADDLAGLGVYETAEALLAKYEKAAISCIGPAGEKQLYAAGVATIDKDDVPSRYSGRGGLGAVMGSKGIKAVVILGKSRVTAARADEFAGVAKAFNQATLASPLTEAYRDYGTAAMVEYINALTGLPIRNFSYGQDERAADIGGNTMYDTIRARGGSGHTSHACMPGCLVRCSNVYADEAGEPIVSPVEYENIGLLGPNLDIWDLDSIARLNYRCNDVGVDTIEIGAAIGVAMEAGLLAFGDFEGAMDALDQVGRGTVLGRLIGSGATITGKVLGVPNIPAVRGQAMAAYDPRAIKGMGVTYATSAMGADHTAGPAARAQVDHHDAEGKAQLSRKLQKLLGVFDATGLCLFTVGAVPANKDKVLAMVNARFDWDRDMAWMDKMCIRMLQDEKRFNELAGIAMDQHGMPEAFTERKMPGIDTVFDISEEDLLSVYDYDQGD